ncbi:hypothetical protein K439DRAFT_1306332, partial [Ramaria rubella]
GIHPVFHTLLLRIYHANDDRRFPGREIHNMPGFAMNPKEWAVEKILRHSGNGSDSIFEILFKLGDTAWMPYTDVQHLQAVELYLEAVGADSIAKL